MRPVRLLLLLAPFALLLAGSVLPPASAQDVDAADADGIVITARLSGAPMWTIDTPAGTVVLVGEIREVPKTTPWRPERLEGAAERAQRIILGTRAKISPGDILRLIFKGGKLTRLPDKREATDYLEGERLARLQALESRYGQSYARRNFLITAYDLLSRRLEFNKDTADDASDVVRKAARRRNVPMRPVGEMRGEDMLDNLFAAAPQTHIPCLDAAMTAAEAGRDGVTARGAAWTGFDIPAVMANPLEVALGRCWPWSDDGLGSTLRGQWVDAIGEAVGQPGVTLAVVPLRVLAEPDGVLDRLQRVGHSIRGPAWR